MWKPQAFIASLADAQEPSRVLLCRPHGGLNDTLCRISECLTYAARFGRHLIIDTSRPICVRGRIDRYRAVSVPGAGNVVDADTGLSVRFAEAGTPGFELDYDEELLVHEAHGGGTTSADLLPRLRLAPEISQSVRSALASLAHGYSGIHIRNTDLNTDWRALFRQVRQHGIEGHVLVCSDDPRVTDCARSMLANPVLAFGGRPMSRNRSGALHLAGAYADPSQFRAAAVNALIDLCALGEARMVFCGQTMAQRVSGFSFLACHLCRNKGLIDSLMGVPEAERRKPDPTAAVILDVNGGWRHRMWRMHRLVSRARERVGRFLSQS